MISHCYFVALEDELHVQYFCVNDVHVSVPTRQNNRMRAGRYSLSLYHYLLTTSLPVMAPSYLLSRTILAEKTRNINKGCNVKFSKEELFISVIGSVPCS